MVEQGLSGFDDFSSKVSNEPMAKRAGEDSVHHDLEGQTQKYRNVGDRMDSDAQWIDLSSIQNEGK